MSIISSVQSLSRVWLFATPWTRSTPGLPVHHQLPEFTETHVHRVGDAIQPSHPLTSPSCLALNLSVSGSFQMSQFFTSGGQSTGVSAFQWILRTDFLYNGLVGSPCSPRDSQKSSPTPQFKSVNSLALSLLHGPAVISIHDSWKNCSFD